MRNKPKVLSSQLTSTERRVYGAATLLFVGIFVVCMWPIYAYFSRIRPFVLGMPFSLFYLVALVGVSFFTLLALYRWEDRRGTLDETDERGR